MGARRSAPWTACRCTGPDAQAILNGGIGEPGLALGVGQAPCPIARPISPTFVIVFVEPVAT